MPIRISAFCAAAALGLVVSPALSAETNLNVPSGKSRTASASKSSSISAPLAITTAPAAQHFISINTCRVFGNFALPARTATGFQITGSGGMTPQGGPSTGCGIPTYATAVAINLSASSTSNGSMTAYALGAPFSPLASVSYRAGTVDTAGSIVAISSTGRMAIWTSTASRVYGDVTGYFVPAFYSASLFADGTINRGEGVDAATTTRFSAGTYEVGFTRDITECFYQVTAGEGGVGEAAPRITGVTRRSGNPNGVFVQIRNDAGTNIDSAFFVTVSCGR